MVALTGAPPLSVVVVGGGVCGLSAAATLARSLGSGADSGQTGSVLVLDSGELGGPQCASAMCCGLIDNMGFPTNCGGENELDAILILGTQRIYEELHSRRDISFERRLCLTLAVTPAQQKYAEHEVATLKSLGYRHVQYLSGDEARALEPLLSEDVLGAVCLPEASTADPHKTVAAMVMEAREAGAVIHEHAPCLAIHQRPDGRYEASCSWQHHLALAFALCGLKWLYDGYYCI